MRLLIFLACLLLPISAQAMCEGRDLRPDMTPEMQNELQQALADILFPEGNHWIANKGDTVLHVVGTMHLTDPRMDAIVARLMPTLSQADAFYFEVTQDEMDTWEQKLAVDPSPILITTGPTLIDLLSEEDWANLSSTLAERGIPGWMAAKMRPWFLGMTLAMPACLMQDPDANRGLDARLNDLAEKKGIPQFSLESIEELMAMFEIYTIEEQVESLARWIKAYDGGHDQLATVNNVYFDENHAQSIELGRILAREYSGMSHEVFDEEWSAFEQHMLIERNNKWMQHILQIKDQTAVIAVGAGHLSGEHGLLHQLQQAGYTLTRAPF